MRWTEKILREQPRHTKTNRLLADYYEKKGSHGRTTSISCRPSPSLEPGWNRSESHEIKLNPAYGDIDRSEFSPVGVSVFLSACHRFGDLT